MFGEPASQAARRQRIALIGLRGAGKSTLGRALAEGWKVPFVELNRGIEALAGCTLSEIHSLYGPAAYRRYEKRALEDAIQRYPRAVIATPGGIVSDPATFNLLLAHCYTVWVRATPEEHMGRVLAQGDTRPMAGHTGNAEAMNDLRRILESRAAFYSKADAVFDTSEMSPEAALEALRELLREIGQVLAVVPNHLTLEGHTDAQAFSAGERGYSNWELSSDRANASRREINAGGLPEDRVLLVQGLASSVLFDPSAPDSPVNRRISIIVMNREAEDRLRRITRDDEEASPSAGTDEKLSSTSGPVTR